MKYEVGYMRMEVYKSKYTPGVKPEDTRFSKRDTVTYKTRSGNIYDVNVVSDGRVKHGETGLMGYEAIFPDDHKQYFIAEKDIINWQGKA